MLGAEVDVRRNDEISVAAALDMAPSHLCISPGPGTPYDAGVSMDMIRAFAGRVPVLGVCLGHQSIVEVFGGKVVRAKRLMHGKTSRILHDGRTLFAGLPQDCEVGRYHSLIAEPSAMPAVLEISARTHEDEIMGAPPSHPDGGGRAVPPREHPVPGRTPAAGQLPQANRWHA